jgi:hypothetical protein
MRTATGRTRETRTTSPTRCRLKPTDGSRDVGALSAVNAGRAVVRASDMLSRLLAAACGQRASTARAALAAVTFWDALSLAPDQTRGSSPSVRDGSSSRRTAS